MRKLKFLYLSLVFGLVTAIGTLYSGSAYSQVDTWRPQTNSSLPDFHIFERTQSSRFFEENIGAEQAAARWFYDRGILPQDIQNISESELALRLLASVYAFCQAGAAPNDLNMLFISCNATCGGISYVLRGLLELVGIETRYANLYNIPNQGNHTGVEFKSEGRWAFLDPTFGAVFSENGNINGGLASLRDLHEHYPVGSLSDKVLQVRDEDFNFLDTPLTDIYSGFFDHDYMELVNYQVAELIGYHAVPPFRSLDVSVFMHENVGDLGWRENHDFSDASWLEATNATLRDANLSNDVSYNSGQLRWSDNNVELSTLSIYDLEPGQQYRMKLAFSGNRILEVFSVGKLIRFPSPIIFDLTGSDMHILDLRFSSQRDAAVFLVRNSHESGYLFLRGVLIVPEES